MRHNVVVDVSGRMEKRSCEHTALAFSNGIEASIFVLGKVKLAVNDGLLQRGVPRKKAGVRILVAGLYLLLEDFLDQIGEVVIDDELPSWGNEIKRELLTLVKQKIQDFDESQIDIRSIKKDPRGQRADQLAWLTRTKKRKPHRRITFQDLLSVVERIH